MVILLGCVHLLGGSYGLLQVVAWANMLVEYSAEQGLATGFRQTFDGQHPCELCLSIEKAKHEEDKSPSLMADKLSLKDLLPCRAIAASPPRAVALTDPGHPEPPGARSRAAEAPTPPPPRLRA